MKIIPFLSIVVLCMLYACNGNAKNSLNTAYSNSNQIVADKNQASVNEPDVKSIIAALENAIAFCDTANREQFRQYLGATEAQINSVSDEEFIEIKKDNAYLYENIVSTLKKDEVLFKIISNANGVYEISFSENEVDAMSVVLSFSYTKDNVLVLDSLNTP